MNSPELHETSSAVVVQGRSRTAAAARGRAERTGSRPPGTGTKALLAACLGFAAVSLKVSESFAAASPFGAAQGAKPNLAEAIERPMRYHPEAGDFVIVNGPEFFNRPLYGGNTAFRVDTGDRPECVLYLPGRGGNLRLGLRRGARCLWLHEAARVEARYRPGSLRYEITDPLLGDAGRLKLVFLAVAETEGLLVRIEALDTPPDLEWVWVYGGMNGQRGARDGDIGTERVPISQWFQLKPEFCAGNTVELRKDAFLLRGKPAAILGHVPPGTQLVLADAEDWNRLEALCAQPGGTSRVGKGGTGTEGSSPQGRVLAPKQPVVVGLRTLRTGESLLLALQRVAVDSAQALPSEPELDVYRKVTDRKPAGKKEAAPSLPLLPAYGAAELPAVWNRTEAHFEALRRQLEVDTPDAHFNAAVAALNVAADAVWDEPQGAVMHGAIAWRSKLLGWRGPYAMDALGWHDRARRHLGYWATRQNTTPVPDRLPPADAASNLARSEAALHSNGDMSNSHYDMNLVYMDALFRHLRWTGDLSFARQVWPVIERHLAWERRLFRREYGAERAPLYEAYAAIWASDDLQYHGAGTTHASAYNFLHNREAARLAALIGADGAPYAAEAEAIAGAMRRWLWIPAQGGFGEYRDLLGGRLLHENAGLWTFYHAIDSEVPTREEMAAMVAKLAADMPRIPVAGPGVPHGLYVMPSTTWMPYTWSLNNVVMGENVHTALALWRAGEAAEAWRLMRGAVIASMFMGICPGNVGSMNYLDVYRRESQRDFADGGGVLSRAIVEGVFGVRPDMLAGELCVTPGWPSEWEKARLRHARVELSFSRSGDMDTYRIGTRLGRPVRLRLGLSGRGTAPVGASVNGRQATPRMAAGGGRDLFYVEADAAESFEVSVVWPAAARDRIRAEGGGKAVRLAGAGATAEDAPVDGIRGFDWQKPLAAGASMRPVPLRGLFNDRVSAIFSKGKYLTPRSPHCSLALPSQGLGAWAGHVNAMAEIDDSGLRRAAGAGGGAITLPNGVRLETPSEAEAPNILFVSQWDNYPRESVIPLTGRAGRIVLLVAGSTNAMQSQFDNGEIVVGYADGTTTRLVLRNPTNWWPIEQDYFLDDYAFRRPGPLPPRLDLRTGTIRLLEEGSFKGRGGQVPGGAATLLALRLDPSRDLRSLTVRALANEVVIGLMAATLLP